MQKSFGFPIPSTHSPPPPGEASLLGDQCCPPLVDRRRRADPHGAEAVVLIGNERAVVAAAALLQLRHLGLAVDGRANAVVAGWDGRAHRGRDRRVAAAALGFGAGPLWGWDCEGCRGEEESGRDEALREVHRGSICELELWADWLEVWSVASLVARYTLGFGWFWGWKNVKRQSGEAVSDYISWEIDAHPSFSFPRVKGSPMLTTYNLGMHH